MIPEKRRFQQCILIPVMTLVSVACILVDRGNQVEEKPSPTTNQVLETQSLPTQDLVMDMHGDHIVEISIDGQNRQFRLHVPPTYHSNQPVPLVLNFHGYNSNAAQQENVSQMSAKADQAGFVVAYPEGLGDPQTWHVGPREERNADLEFIQELVSNLQGQLSIDPARIYATGISNGAQMANLLGCELSEIFAAIAPVSEGYPPTQECNSSRPVPVVAFHGTSDRLIPFEGQGRLLLPAHDWAAAWAARNGCDPVPYVSFQNGDVTGETWGNCHEDAEVTFYTIQGGGHSWPGSDMPTEITTQDIDATDVIWDFFSAHPMP